MKPQEKAKELVERYKSLKWQSGNYKRSIERGVSSYGVSKASQRQMTMEAAKQCAIIAVDEIIKAVHVAQTEIEEYKQYWNEVKTEIENL